MYIFLRYPPKIIDYVTHRPYAILLLSWLSASILHPYYRLEDNFGSPVMSQLIVRQSRPKRFARAQGMICSTEGSRLRRVFVIFRYDAELN